MLAFESKVFFEMTILVEYATGSDPVFLCQAGTPIYQFVRQ